MIRVSNSCNEKLNLWKMSMNFWKNILIFGVSPPLYFNGSMHLSWHGLHKAPCDVAECFLRTPWMCSWVEVITVRTRRSSSVFKLFFLGFFLQSFEMCLGSLSRCSIHKTSLLNHAGITWVIRFFTNLWSPRQLECMRQWSETFFFFTLTVWRILFWYLLSLFFKV